MATLSLSPIQEFFQTPSMKEKMSELIANQITSNDSNLDSAAQKASEIGCLIKLGAEIETKNHNFFLLAVLNGKFHIVNILIDHGAHIQAKTKNHGETPLHIAVRKGQLEVAKILIDRGAQIEARNNIEITPIHPLGSGRTPS